MTEQTATRRGPVREEDAFDVEAVAAWLRDHATAFRDDLVGTPGGAPVPGRRLQPHLPAPIPRPGR